MPVPNSINCAWVAFPSATARTNGWLFIERASRSVSATRSRQNCSAEVSSAADGATVWTMGFLPGGIDVLRVPCCVVGHRTRNTEHATRTYDYSITNEIAHLCNR